MNVMAATSPVGSNGVIFLPCMQGAMTPTWNGNARGTFTGLTLNNNFDDLARAVFEGIAFGLRDNVDRFEEIGMDCSNVRIVGGSTKSPLWCQMKADLLGKPMTATKSAEGAAIGAAMLASVAEGNFKDLDEAAEAMVELGATYEPDVQKRHPMMKLMAATKSVMLRWNYFLINVTARKEQNDHSRSKTDLCRS